MTMSVTRSRHDRMIAGVCGGLGERFQISPLKIRATFVLSCVIPGPQFLLYIVLWVVMPKRP